MTANLHAIWLDDLAPGESGSNPIWDATFAETDDETRVYLRALMTSGPVDPVAVETEFPPTPLDPFVAAITASVHNIIEAVDGKPKPKKKPAPRKPAAKKSTPRKKPGVLVDAETKLAGVAARVKAQTDEMGGAS